MYFPATHTNGFFCKVLVCSDPVLGTTCLDSPHTPGALKLSL